MYKLNDVKKLKKDELIDIIKSKNIKVSKKSTKSEIIDILVSHGCVNTNKSENDLISPVVSVDFSSPNLQYVILSDANLNQLPTVTFENIYRHCC